MTEAMGYIARRKGDRIPEEDLRDSIELVNDTESHLNSQRCCPVSLVIYM